MPRTLSLWNVRQTLRASGRRSAPSVIGVFALLGGAAVRAQAPPSPALLVLNKEDSTLSLIDPSSGVTVVRIATGDGPHEVAVSADGRTAFVSNYGRGRVPGTSLSVIDLETRRERRVELAPLADPHGLFVSAGKAYFTAEANRAIGRYDPSTDTVDWVMGTGQGTTHMVMASADGARLYATNVTSDSVTIMERGGNSLPDWTVTTVPTGSGPEGLDLSPNGRELWAAHSFDGGVSIVDVAAKKVTATFDIGTRRSNRLKFTPDGRHVLVSDLDAGELVVLDATRHRVIKRVRVGAQPEGILIVPDGSRAYVAVSGDDRLAVVDLRSFDVTGTIATGDGPDGMAWIE